MSRGIATLTSFCKNGVTTMKMISSTSMTSTIGVTLISDCIPPVPPACIPISQTPFVVRVRRAREVAETASSLTRSHPPARELRIQLLRAILDKIVNQLGSRIVHLHDEAINLAGKVVEEPHRRNGNHQTERRGKKRFRNAARDRRNTL